MFLIEHIDSFYMHLLSSFPPFPWILSINNLLLTCSLPLLFFHAGKNLGPSFPWRGMICEKHNKNGKAAETSVAGRQGLEGQWCKLPCCDTLWRGINRIPGQGKSSTSRSELIPSEDFLSVTPKGVLMMGVWPTGTESPLETAVIFGKGYRLYPANVGWDGFRSFTRRRTQSKCRSEWPCDLQVAHVRIKKGTESRERISNHIGSGVDFNNFKKILAATCCLL